MQRDDMMEDIEFNIKSVDMNDSQVQKWMQRIKMAIIWRSAIIRMWHELKWTVDKREQEEDSRSWMDKKRTDEKSLDTSSRSRECKDQFLIDSTVLQRKWGNTFTFERDERFKWAVKEVKEMSQLWGEFTYAVLHA